MTPKVSARIAWSICTIVIIGAIAASVYEISNRPFDDNIFKVAEDIFTFVSFPVFGLMGTLIVTRQPRNTVGWLLILVSTLVFGWPLDSYVSNLTAAPIHPSRFLLFSLWFSNWSWTMLLFPILYIALLFPTGLPPAPRWGWVAYVGLGLWAIIVFFITFSTTFGPADSNWVVLNPIGFIPISAFPFLLIFITVTAFAVLCVFSLLFRYRSADHREQNQIKWLLYAASFFVLNLVLGFLWGELGNEWASFGTALLFLAIMLMPIAIAIAILRYRLFDINVIIRKTLQYALLTGLLVLVYYVSVILLQSLVKNLTGEQSPLVIVLSTLAIAALFNPLRIRIQEFIDRRFYRKKYDAEQALAQFAATTRDEVDMEKLTFALLSVVEETMQPEVVGLWLKSDPKSPSRGS